MIGKMFKSKSVSSADDEEVKTLDESLGSSKTNEKASKILRKDLKIQMNEVKILLLGAGESGKSTVFKQMKIINISDYTMNERVDFKEHIAYNILTEFKMLIEGCEKLQIKLKNEKTQDTSYKILENTKNIKMIALEVFTKEFVKDLVEFWKDEDIQLAYSKRSELNLGDSASYFFNKIEELIQKSYIPSNKDILFCRRKTTGVTETTFQDKSGVSFKMIDVGGQRTERRKWLKLFDNVTAVLFITSMSEYDQNLYEDENKNRMVESLELFEEILELPYFKKTSIIVFFNKYDLFKEKIKKVDIGKYFNHYKGGFDEDNGAKFIESIFLSKNKLHSRKIISHRTNATDTDLIKNIFNDIKLIVLQKYLEDSKLF